MSTWRVPTLADDTEIGVLGHVLPSLACIATPVYVRSCIAVYFVTVLTCEQLKKLLLPELYLEIDADVTVLG